MDIHNFFNPRKNQKTYNEARNAFVRFLKDVGLYTQYKVNLCEYQLKYTKRYEFELKPCVSTFLYETSIYYWLSRAFQWDGTTEGKDTWSTLNLLWGAKLITLFNNELDEQAKNDIAQIIASSTIPSIIIIQDLSKSNDIPQELKEELKKLTNEYNLRL